MCPAKSKAQQQFMGIVHGLQKGTIKPSDVSPEARKVAKNIDPKDAEDFAKTKHKGLPKHVKKECDEPYTEKVEEQKEKVKNLIKSLVREVLRENKLLKEINQQAKDFIADQLVNAWEEMDSREMFRHLSSQIRGVDKNKLKKLVDNWYKDYRRRNQVIMLQADIMDWIREYL